ncbi:MAG: hypothetical protein A2252_00855 [Elusimicrobia bacterium RIFOXYA2_FULL_39_19]|nr:MAG: hypothetical protein A2252_00855 [Elusimicrobia bacterium RIFOXYA2_FULL_39_19]
MLKIKYILIIFVSLMFCGPLIQAQDSSDKKILILYKQRESGYENTVNYLGYILKEAGFSWDSADIETLLKEKKASDLSDYTGVLASYQTPDMINADKYPYFLIDLIDAGKKVVLIGNYGAYQNLAYRENNRPVKWNESLKNINSFFYSFGLEFYFGWTGTAENMRITLKDSAMVEYQAPIDLGQIKYYQLFKSVNPSNRVHLEIERTDVPDSKSAIVVQTPYGGMILEGYSYFWDAGSARIVQRVNMAEFFKNCFLSDIVKFEPRFNFMSQKELRKKYPLPKIKNDALKHVKNEEKRNVLIYFKTEEAKEAELSITYRRLNLALNHLGLNAIYWSDAKGLPGESVMKDCRGVITWHLSAQMRNADAYGNWLIKQIKKKRKVIIFENYGADIDFYNQTRTDKASEVFKALGFEYSDLRPNIPARFPVISRKDDKIVGFEQPLDAKQLVYQNKIKSVLPQNKTILSVNDYANGEIALVAVSPFGAIAMGNSAFYFSLVNDDRIDKIRKVLDGKMSIYDVEELKQGKWVINPFIFLAQALGIENYPMPDYTTLNGSRIFMSHIDADGFESVSGIDNIHYAGSFVLNEIFSKYPDIKFSCSMLPEYIASRGNRYYNRSADIARKIYQLPNVEPATHSNAHPFNWVGGDPYVINPGSYPAKIGHTKPDLINEIWVGKLYMDKNLTPEGKECSLILWSGLCNPDEETLRITKAAGMENINGGDPIYDDKFDSISNLCPLGINKGKYWQLHTAARNDYLYMNSLQGKWDGMKNVVRHYEKTGFPYRLMPMDLYFHFYSGLSLESIDSLKYVLDYVKTQDAVSIFTSEYCRIAGDFINMRVWREKNGDWRFLTKGHLRTLRFDKIVFPDMVKSEGIMGYCTINDNIYIHLDNSKEYRLVLAEKEKHIPHLHSSTFKINTFKNENGNIKITFNAGSKGSIKIADLIPEANYKITVTDANKQSIISSDVKVDYSGMYIFQEYLPDIYVDYEIQVVKQ